MAAKAFKENFFILGSSWDSNYSAIDRLKNVYHFWFSGIIQGWPT
jgi:hypothetical protein